MTLEEELQIVWGANECRFGTEEENEHPLEPSLVMLAASDYELAIGHSKNYTGVIREAGGIDYVQACKETRRIIKARLMEALTSPHVYFRCFAQLVAKE